MVYMGIIFLINLMASVLVSDLKNIFLDMRLLLNSLGNPNFDYRLSWNTKMLSFSIKLEVVAKGSIPNKLNGGALTKTIIVEL